MTDEPQPADSGGTGSAMMACSVCQTDVPAGEYCGLCGGHLGEHRNIGPHWLRIDNFSAAPGEHLLRPNIVSSLFPHLSAGSRTPFLLGLILLLVALTAATVFRLPAALITVAALGLPLLFLIYLQEADVYRDIPPAALVTTAGLGIGLGVGFVLLTGAAVARSYGVPLGAGIAGARVLKDGLGVPLGGLLLMLVPVLVMRLRRRVDQESLDGFAIGALGALMFTGAATLTRFTPQFQAGMVARARPMDGLIVQAGIHGIAVPITAASVGGLVGAALWFTRPPTKKHQHPGYVRLALIVIAVSVMAAYAVPGVIDVVRIPQLLLLALHLGLSAIALLALRVGLHLALLHEVHDEVDDAEPIQCTECGYVVPDMPFCVKCGAAMRASSRSSRRRRRETRPSRVEPRSEPQ